MERATQQKYRDYLDSELEAVHMYTALAEAERDPERAQIFRDLVDIEMRHAAKWADKLGIDPASLDPGRRGLKPRLLKLGAAVFGTNRVLPVLLRLEADEIDAYAGDPEAADILDEELDHTAKLAAMAGVSMEDVTLRNERTHRVGLGGLGNNLRAAVMGMNDGLVSNLSLVMGVSGGVADPDIVMLAGSAGLLAGASSMAAGEYISVRSQRDLYEYQIRQERIEIEESPEEEQEELRLIYRAKGLGDEDARRLAAKVMSDPDVALDTMAREELGLDPDELGSPVGAAVSSFLAFSVGAIVPLLPYLLQLGGAAFVLSAVLSGVALFVVGAVLGGMTGRHPLWGAARMLLAGGVAAGVTFGIGRLIGISIMG